MPSAENSNANQSPGKKKYVFVVVHGDMWGAYNANDIVKAVKVRGVEPVLFVSKSSRHPETGEILSALKDLKLLAKIKETDLETYFSRLDKMHFSQSEEPPYLTFKKLADKYCPDHVVHWLSSGGEMGGAELEAEITRLGKNGVKPECLLSGDTMAFLPAGVTDTIDCFSAHPGSLDDHRRNAGANCSERAILGDAFYDYSTGTLMEPGTRMGYGATCVKGSLFKQVKMDNPSEIDKGPVIETVLSPVLSKDPLLQVRRDLYYFLVEAMIRHMDEFLDPARRKKLIREAEERQTAKAHAEQKEVPKLNAEKFRTWQGDRGKPVTIRTVTPPGLVWTPESARTEIKVLGFEPNIVVDTNRFRNRMLEFYPRNVEKGAINLEFEKIFSEIFGETLTAIDKQRAQRLQEARDAEPRITFR